MSDNYKLKKNFNETIERQKKHFQKLDTVIAKTHDELNYYMNDFNGDETLDGLKNYKQYFEIYELCLQEISDQLIFHDLDFMAKTIDILFKCFKELFSKFLKFMNDFAMTETSNLQFENKTLNSNNNKSMHRQSRMSINFDNKYEILEKAQYYLKGTQKELDEIRDDYEIHKFDIESFINNKDYLSLEASQADKQLISFINFNERKLGKLKQAIYQGEAETDFLMKSTNNHGDEAYDDLKQNMLIEFGQKYRLLFKKFQKYYVLKEAKPPKEMIEVAIQTEMYKPFQESIHIQTDFIPPDTHQLEKLKQQLGQAFDKHKSLEDQLNDQKNIISSQIYTITKKKGKIQQLREKNSQQVEEINFLKKLNEKFQRDVHDLNIKSQMLDNYTVNAQIESANKINNMYSNLLNKEEQAQQAQQQIFLKSQQIQTTEQQLQKLTQQLQKQNETIEQQIQMINELTQQLGELQIKYEIEVEDYESQIKLLKGDQKSQFEYIFLQNEKEKKQILTEMSQIIKQKEVENMDLISLRDQLAKEIQKLNEELVELIKKRDEEKQKYASEIGSLKQNQQQLEIDLDKTKKTIQSLQSRSPKYSLAQHNIDIQDLEKKIQTSQTTIDYREKQIENMEKKIKDYEEKLQFMQQNVKEISEEMNLLGQLNINERENIKRILDCLVLIQDPLQRTRAISDTYQYIQNLLNKTDYDLDHIRKKYQQSVTRYEKQIQTQESMMDQEMRKSKIKTSNRFTNMILDNLKKTEMMTGPAMLVNSLGNYLNQKSETKKPIKSIYTKFEQKNEQTINQSLNFESQIQKEIQTKQEEIKQIMNQTSQNETQITLKKQELQNIIEQGDDENFISQKQIEIQQMEQDVRSIDEKIKQKQNELLKIIDESKNNQNFHQQEKQIQQQQDEKENLIKYRDMNRLSKFYDKSVMESRRSKNQLDEEQIPIRLFTPKKKNSCIEVDINNIQNSQLKNSVYLNQTQYDKHCDQINTTPPKIRSISRHSSAKTLRSQSAQSKTKDQNYSPKSKQKVTFRKSIEKFLPSEQFNQIQTNSQSKVHKNIIAFDNINEKIDQVNQHKRTLEHIYDLSKAQKNIIALDNINEKIDQVNQHKRTSEYIYDQIKKLQQPKIQNDKPSRRSLSNYQFISVNQRIARTSSVTELPEDYQISYEQVHAYYLTLVETHQKCGKNCIHIRNFIENIGPFTTQQIKNNQLQLPKINQNN